MAYCIDELPGRARNRYNYNSSIMNDKRGKPAKGGTVGIDDDIILSLSTSSRATVACYFVAVK